MTELFKCIDNSSDSGDVEKNVFWADEYIEIKTHQADANRFKTVRIPTALVSVMIEEYYYDLSKLWKLLCDSIRYYTDRILFSVQHIAHYDEVVDSKGRAAYKVFEGKVDKGEDGETWKVAITTNSEYPFDLEIAAKLSSYYERRHYYRIEAFFLKPYFEKHCLELYSNQEKNTPETKSRSSQRKGPYHRRETNHMFQALLDELLFDKEQDEIYVKSIEMMRLEDFVETKMRRKHGHRIDSDDEYEEKKVIEKQPKKRNLASTTTLASTVLGDNNLDQLSMSDIALDPDNDIPPSLEKYDEMNELMVNTGKKQTSISMAGTSGSKQYKDFGSFLSAISAVNREASIKNQLQEMIEDNQVIIEKTISATLHKFDQQQQLQQQSHDHQQISSSHSQSHSPSKKPLQRLSSPSRRLPSYPQGLEEDDEDDENNQETLCENMKQALLTQSHIRSQRSLYVIVKFLTSNFCQLSSFLQYSMFSDLLELARACELMETTILTKKDYERYMKGLGIDKEDSIGNIFILLGGNGIIETTIKSTESEPVIHERILKQGDIIGEKLFYGEYNYGQTVRFEFVPLKGDVISLCRIPAEILLRCIGKQGKEVEEYMIWFWKSAKVYLDILRYNKNLVSTSIDHNLQFQLQRKLSRLDRDMRGSASALNIRWNYKTLFDQIDTLQPMNVIESARIRSYRAGEIIFQQGNHREYMYIMKQGSATYFRHFPKEEVGLDIIPEYVRTNQSIEYDLTHDKSSPVAATTSDASSSTSSSKKKPTVNNIELIDGDLLSNDFSFCDSEDLFYAQTLLELEKEYAELVNSMKTMNTTPNNATTKVTSSFSSKASPQILSLQFHNRISKFARYGKHKNTLIANNHCDIVVIPLQEVCKSSLVVKLLLELACTHYSFLLYSNEDVIRHYHLHMVWLQERQLYLQSIEEEKIDKLSLSDYYLTNTSYYNEEVLLKHQPGSEEYKAHFALKLTIHNQEQEQNKASSSSSVLPPQRPRTTTATSGSRKSRPNTATVVMMNGGGNNVEDAIRPLTGTAAAATNTTATATTCLADAFAAFFINTSPTANANNGNAKSPKSSSSTPTRPSSTPNTSKANKPPQGEQLRSSFQSPNKSTRKYSAATAKKPLPTSTTTTNAVMPPPVPSTATTAAASSSSSSSASRSFQYQEKFIQLLHSLSTMQQTNNAMEYEIDRPVVPPPVRSQPPPPNQLHLLHKPGRSYSTAPSTPGTTSASIPSAVTTTNSSVVAGRRRGVSIHKINNINDLINMNNNTNYSGNQKPLMDAKTTVSNNNNLTIVREELHPKESDDTESDAEDSSCNNANINQQQQQQLQQQANRSNKHSEFMHQLLLVNHQAQDTIQLSGKDAQQTGKTPEDYVQMYRDRSVLTPKERFVNEFIRQVHL